MPRCSSCNALEASLRCSACSKLRPASAVPIYCNRDCQKAHWKKEHRSYCKLAQYYDKVKHLDGHASKNGIEIVKAVASMGAPSDVQLLLISYLTHVDMSIRELTIRIDTRLTSEVCDMIRGVRTEFPSAEAYMASYTVLCPTQIQEVAKLADPTLNIPFICRPWLAADYDESPHGVFTTKKSNGMELMPYDWAVLDLESYERVYGGHRRHAIDPWSCSNPEAIRAELFRDTDTPTLP